MALKSKEEFLESMEPLECPVCYETVEDPFQASCWHVFCIKCIRQWLQDHRSCPKCRKRLYDGPASDNEEESEDEDEEEVEEEDEEIVDNDDEDDDYDEDEAMAEDEDEQPPAHHHWQQQGVEHLNLDFEIDQDYALVARSYEWGQLTEYLEVELDDENEAFGSKPCLVSYGRLVDFAVGTLLQLKPDRTRHGDFTQDEMCRDEWTLVATSVEQTLSQFRATILPAWQLIHHLKKNWTDLRAKNWPERIDEPEYAAALPAACAGDIEYLFRAITLLSYRAAQQDLNQNKVEEAGEFFNTRFCERSILRHEARDRLGPVLHIRHMDDRDICECGAGPLVPGIVCTTS